jgi:hypothetical protein
VEVERLSELVSSNKSTLTRLVDGAGFLALRLLPLRVSGCGGWSRGAAGGIKIVGGSTSFDEAVGSTVV